MDAQRTIVSNTIDEMQVTAVFSSTVHIDSEGSCTHIQREKDDLVYGQKERKVQTHVATHEITYEYFKIDG